MRRNEREIKDYSQIQDILARGKVCHMGMHDGEFPYVLPLSYGIKCEDGIFTFYFHCAAEGKKIDLLKIDSKVCIEVEADISLICAEYPCGHSMAYSSVIAFGKAEFITDEKEKCQALNYIMKQHLDNQEMRLKDGSVGLSHITCFKVTAVSITGKRNGL